MLTPAIMLKFHNLTVFSTTNNEQLDIHCIITCNLNWKKMNHNIYKRGGKYKKKNKNTFGICKYTREKGGVKPRVRIRSRRVEFRKYM